MRKFSPRVMIAMSAMLVPGVVFAAQWARTYGGEGPDIAAAVQPTADGHYVVAGNRYTPNPPDAWVFKVDSRGNLVWQSNFGDSDNGGYARSIQPTPDGGYLVAGTSRRGRTPQDWSVDRAMVAKLDSAGAMVWQQIYAEEGYVLSSLELTADGGFVAVGYQPIAVSGRANGMVLKVDSAGAATWRKRLGDTIDDKSYVNSVRQTADGGYVVAATLSAPGTEGWDAWVLKLDRTGSVTWQKTYGGPGQDWVADMQTTTDGGLVLGGSTDSYGSGENDFWILKLDASGTIVWQKTYGGPRNDRVASIRLTTDGGYIVAGSTHSFGAGGVDALVMKLDAEGGIIWQWTYGGGFDDIVQVVQRALDGGYIVAGTAGLPDATGPYSTNAWLLKLDSEGTISGCEQQIESGAIASASNAVERAIGAITPPFSTASSEGTMIARRPTATSVLQCYDPSPASKLKAIEYYHREFGHYFVTALGTEVAALDSGIFSGWSRTGESFNVYGVDSDTASVCRFWSGQTFAPKSSHFYTPYADECAKVKQDPDWQFEGHAFALRLPEAGLGYVTCPSDTRPLYRAYNRGMSGAPNHRYTTDAAVLGEMVAQGWQVEGNLWTRIFACVPAQE
jgi:hypothetical protein